MYLFISWFYYLSHGEELNYGLELYFLAALFCAELRKVLMTHRRVLVGSGVMSGN